MGSLAAKNITPTQERIARGDLEFTTRGVYRSVFPTALEAWDQIGFLGEGVEADCRFSACEILFTLAQATQLMASNTTDYGRLPGSSTREEADVGPIDHIRFIMNQVSMPTSKIFRDLIATPDCMMRHLNRQQVMAAMDELVVAIEIWKDSGLCDGYIEGAL